MQSTIIYYSYSGNTREVAIILGRYLKNKGEVDVREIKAQDEPQSFFAQAKRALFRKRAQILEVQTDLAYYDLICIGSPVWAFGPAPAINTYLDRCSGIEGKKVVLFTTYGSGTGNGRCLNYMQGILARKGAGPIKRFSIQQAKARNREFVEASIQEAV